MVSIKLYSPSLLLVLGLLQLRSAIAVEVSDCHVMLECTSCQMWTSCKWCGVRSRILDKNSDKLLHEQIEGGLCAQHNDPPCEDMDLQFGTVSETAAKIPEDQLGNLKLEFKVEEAPTGQCPTVFDSVTAPYPSAVLVTEETTCTTDDELAWCNWTATHNPTNSTYPFGYCAWMSNGLCRMPGMLEGLMQLNYDFVIDFDYKHDGQSPTEETSTTTAVPDSEPSAEEPEDDPTATPAATGKPSPTLPFTAVTTEQPNTTSSAVSSVSPSTPLVLLALAVVAAIV